MKKAPDPRDLFTSIRCEMSSCRRWRYWWEAVWDEALPPLVMCALNPSTADEWSGDPTINRMVQRGRENGFGRFIMVNGAAFRSTDPKNLYDLDRAIAIGPDNDQWLALAAKRCTDNGGTFVCAWGVHLEKVLPGRSQAILDIITAAGAQPMAYRITKAGHPGHPLYLSYSLLPTPYEQRSIDTKPPEGGKADG